MNAVIIIVGLLVGGALSLLLLASLLGWLSGVAASGRVAGWPGIVVAVILGAWGLAAVALLVSWSVLFVLWAAPYLGLRLTDTQEVTALARWVAEYSLWPTILGVPLAKCVGCFVGRWRYDAG